MYLILAASSSQGEREYPLFRHTYRLGESNLLVPAWILLRKKTSKRKFFTDQKHSVADRHYLLPGL